MNTTPDRKPGQNRFPFPGNPQDRRPEQPQKETGKHPKADSNDGRIPVENANLQDIIKDRIPGGRPEKSPGTPDDADVVEVPGNNNAGNDPIEETVPGNAGGDIPPPIDCLPPVEINEPIESPYDDHPPVDCHPPIFIPEIVIAPPVCPPSVATVCQPGVNHVVIVETPVIEEPVIVDEVVDDVLIDELDEKEMTEEFVSFEEPGEAAQPSLTLIIGEAASLEAEGLGNEPGAIAIEVNGIGLPVTINVWQDDLLEINVPKIGLTEATTAKLYLFDSQMTPLAALDVELTMPQAEMK